MTDVTQILNAIEQGDPSAAEQLLPLVYDELRKLAAAKMAQESPGQTLQGTALVHEAYLRLVDVEKAQHWNSRGHFFGAAAEAMRRILVESARRKRATEKHGGAIGITWISTLTAGVHRRRPPLDLLALIDDVDALAKDLTVEEPTKAESCHSFAVFGWSDRMPEAADDARAVSWHKLRNATGPYAKSWLFAELGSATTLRQNRRFGKSS